MRSQLTRIWKCERGVTAVETAIILPILITLTFGTISVGSILFVKGNTLHAARETARTIAIGEDVVGNAQTIANNHLIDLGGMTYTVTGSEVGPDIKVEITVPLAEAALVDVLGIFNSGELKSEITLKKEIG